MIYKGANCYEAIVCKKKLMLCSIAPNWFECQQAQYGKGEIKKLFCTVH